MAHQDKFVPKTSDKGSAYARVKIDLGQTGFFEGREFRSFYEFSIAAGASVWGRFTAPCPFILWNQRITVDAGSLRYKAFSPGTPGGVFVPLPVIGKNRMLERRPPYYEARCTLDQGGTHTGGVQLDVMRIVTPSGGGNAVTQAVTEQERGLPAGTYYIQLENFGASTCTGVYDLWWEERPADAFPDY